MVTDLAQALPSKLLDQRIVWFLGSTVNVLIEAEIFVALVGLRVGRLPGADLFLVDPHPAVFHPSFELVQRFVVVVLADAGVDAVVPAVDTADQVVTVDTAVRHQRTTVQAAAIEHGDRVA